MKPDTERKKYVFAKIHKKKKNMHVHLSKELRKNMKIKRRAIGIRKGDRVKIMRGKYKGSEGTVSKVSVVDRVVFLEGFTRKNSRGKEIPIKFQPSNLMLISLIETKERSEIFGSEAFQQPKQTKKTKYEENVEKASAEPNLEVVKEVESKG
ncbi:MAG: 50S ribosomal protein L24 [Candidatus Bilamarchaeaceae archaeon]